MDKFIESLMEKKDEKKYIITSHVSPDGDNIGSSVAVTLFLKSIGKESYHVLDDEIPNNLRFLTEDDYYIYSSQEIKNEIENSKYVVIALDAGDKHRICIDHKLLDAADLLVNIDHHLSNPYFGDVNYVVENASSTCEVVYSIIEKNFKGCITDKMAEALYTGLVTDTGNFMYPSAVSSSFMMASNLLKYGADKSKVIKNLFRNQDINYKKMVADIILNSMEIRENICVITLSDKYLKKYNVELKDTEDLVNEATDIKGVQIGVLIKQKGHNFYKVSLRAKDATGVNEIAERFGGGGHAKAAGFTYKGTYDSLYEILLTMIQERFTNVRI